MPSPKPHGQIILRLSADLHAAVVQAAEEDERKIVEWCKLVIKHEIERREQAKTTTKHEEI